MLNSGLAFTNCEYLVPKHSVHASPCSKHYVALIHTLTHTHTHSHTLTHTHTLTHSHTHTIILYVIGN